MGHPSNSNAPLKFTLFRAGVHRQQFQYKYFVPEPVNHGWTWDDPTINALLERAIRGVGQLDAYSRIIPDVDTFIHMHVLREASQSSRIEGTQTSIDEAVMDIEQVDPERRDDWQEVQNYIAAMNHCVAALPQRPLSTRLLREAHEILMQEVRGEHKTPGEFRRSQNWIGGSNLSDAVFIPPAQELVADLMSDLEKFWHNDQIEVPLLIRAAISHYQFETIHPFLDGNGRIGRLLITLYLMDRGFLHKPTLYLSDFFERHRASYYDALTRVRVGNDLTHWVRFFLNAVIDTAESSRQVFEKVLALRQEVDAKLVTLGKRAQNAHRVMRHLYSRPAIDTKGIQNLLTISKATANSLIAALSQLGFLQEVTGFQRNRMYVFRRYVDAFKPTTQGEPGAKQVEGRS